MSKLSICVNFFLLKLPIFNFFPCDFSAKIFTKFIKVRKILLIFYCFEYFHFRWRYFNKIFVNIQILRFSSVRFLENEFRPFTQRILVWIQFLVRFKNFKNLFVRRVLLTYRPTFRGFAFGREIEAQKLVLLLMFNWKMLLNFAL